jgi:hypothetical protein
MNRLNRPDSGKNQFFPESERSGGFKLPVSAWCFMTMKIMSRVAVELLTMFGRMLTAARKWSMVALPVVKMMIDVSVEMFRSMEPRSSSDENTARKPIWTIIAIGGTIIRRHLIVAIRANRRLPNLDCNLCNHFATR